MAGTELIDQLSRDLEPTRRHLSVTAASLVWLAASWSIVSLLTVATGPMRPGFGSQLADSMQFAIECAVGAVGIGLAVVAALRLGVPGLAPVGRIVVPAVALLGLWAALVLYSVSVPAFPPSMLGKRPHCVVEIQVFAIPPFALGILLLRRMLPLARAGAGAVLGAAAAGIPALIMQLACMYDPYHALLLHLGPIAVLAALGALLGALLLKRV